MVDSGAKSERAEEKNVEAGVERMESKVKEQFEYCSLEVALR